MAGNLGSLGSLFIDLGANTATFESDIGRAQKLADRAAKDMQARINAASASIAAGLGAIGVASVAAIASVNNIANSIADYKGLSEQIGDTAQAVASLKPVSDVSGVALATVAGASVKLTAALSKQSEESGTAAAAIKALGLDFKSFQQLAPVAQIEAVAAQFALFEDNAATTAVAVALFGKSGAELIPVLNDQADRGERQVVLTQQQIDQADEYSKRLDRAKGDISTLAQRYAADMIPALDAVLNVQKELLKPEYINAAQQLATSLVSIAGGLAKIAANTVGLAQFLGESLAAAVVGPNDAVRISDEIDRIGERISALRRQQSKAQPGSSIYEADARAIAKQEAELAKLQQRLRTVNQFNTPSAAVAAAAAARPGLQFSTAKDGKSGRASEQKFGPMQDQQIKDFLATLKQQDQQVKDFLKAAEEQARQRERIAEVLSRTYGAENAGANYGFGLGTATSGGEIDSIIGKAANAENARYAAELAAFEASREEIIARGDDYYALMQEAASAHQAELTRIEADGVLARQQLLQAQLAVAGNVFGGIADLAQTFGGKAFKAYKAFAIAEAITATISGAIGAFAQASKTFPPPFGQALGAAAAAGVTATGLAQVARIRSTNIGSRRFGGPVAAGGVYEVAEPGNPELIKYGSKTILAMGSQPGTVMPARVASAAGAIADGGGRALATEVNVYNSSGVPARTERNRVGRREIIDVIVEEFADNAGPLRRQLNSVTGLRGRGLI